MDNIKTDTKIHTISMVSALRQMYNRRYCDGTEAFRLAPKLISILSKSECLNKFTATRCTEQENLIPPNRNRNKAGFTIRLHGGCGVFIKSIESIYLLSIHETKYANACQPHTHTRVHGVIENI